MAVPPYVTAGNVIEEAWGDQIADAVVNPFSSSGARSSAITSPTAGMTSTITAASTLNGFEVYNGSSWTKPWSSPWGLISRDQAGGPATSTSGTTETAVFTGTSFTAVANRYYRVSIATTITATAGDSYTMRIREDSTTGTIWWAGNIVFGTGVTKLQVSPSGTRNLTAGGHSMLLTLTRSAGSSAQITALEYANMIVEDIGPQGAPV
jgi:hypothetical protein